MNLNASCHFPEQTMSLRRHMDEATDTNMFNYFTTKTLSPWLVQEERWTTNPQRQYLKPWKWDWTVTVYTLLLPWNYGRYWKENQCNGIPAITNKSLWNHHCEFSTKNGRCVVSWSGQVLYWGVFILKNIMLKICWIHPSVCGRPRFVLKLSGLLWKHIVQIAVTLSITVWRCKKMFTPMTFCSVVQPGHQECDNSGQFLFFFGLSVKVTPKLLPGTKVSPNDHSLSLQLTVVLMLHLMRVYIQTGLTQTGRGE